jgi:hypothetical protein
VVGIGLQGAETYSTAVLLGAQEATLRQVPLRLVHGSTPGDGRPASPSGLQYRQQRGRRLVDGAARDLAGSRLGRFLQISTESSPRTGVELLLAHGRTAVMIVLQRGDGHLPAGTTSAVTAEAGCPTFVTRSGDRLAGGVGVLVVLDPEHDPAPAIALALGEASMRKVALTVLDGREDRAAACRAIRSLGAQAHDVPVRHVEVAPARVAERARDISKDVALMVVVRPGSGEAYGPVGDAVAHAWCPVLTLAAAAAGA